MNRGLNFIKKYLTWVVLIPFLLLAVVPWVQAMARVGERGEKWTVETLKKEVKAMEYEKKRQDPQEQKELKTALVSGQGEWYWGTKTGLYTSTAGKEPQLVEKGPQAEVKSLIESEDGTLWAAGKDGVWRRRGQEWQKCYAEEVHTLTLEQRKKPILVTKHKGTLRSEDEGATWQSVAGSDYFGMKKED
jgi:ligand-binding sensor domain-containing protein